MSWKTLKLHKNGEMLVFENHEINKDTAEIRNKKSRRVLSKYQ
jgi:hypothetical protein